MKRFRITPTALAAALFVGVTTTPAGAQEDPTVSQVKAVVEAVAVGMETGDFASLDTLFSADPGLHIIEGAGVNHGWADYRDDHLKPELESFENFSYRWYAIEPTVSGDAAWSPFRYDLSAETERGTVEIEGRGTIVLQRLDGRWQVVQLHTSGRPKR
jgi:SnoaL-like protein